MNCPDCDHILADPVPRCPNCGAVTAPPPDTRYAWQIHSPAELLGWMFQSTEHRFAFLGPAVGPPMVDTLEKLRGTMPPGAAMGTFLNWFLPGEMRRLSEGRIWGTIEGTSREVVPPPGIDYEAAPVRYKSNTFPDPLIADTVLAATLAGEITWARTKDGGGLKAGGMMGRRPGVWITLTQNGKGSWVMVVTHGEQPLAIERQKDGWFSKCALGKLWNAIEPEPPLPDHAVAPTGPTPTRFVPAGKGLPEGEPLTEPQWSRHVAEGRVMDRGTIGPDSLVMLDVRHVPPGPGMAYTYRAFLLPIDGRPPLLAFNHERSRFGTVCWGMHRGAAHDNHGEAPPAVSFEDFRARALEALCVTPG
jgi:hypothetical protein